MSRSAYVLEALRAQAEHFIALRRDLHRHPELGLAEHRTAEVIAQSLEQWGYQVQRGWAQTGVLATLTRGSAERSLGLRADMDALPIDEASGKPWASVHQGCMHACGHDGHVAMLLCAARFLAQEGRWEGTLNLIFQPAEEHPGGARLMVEEGLFEKAPCDAVYAMHNMPGVPQGHFVLRAGPTLASSDEVTITLHGMGGHGAVPQAAVDPVVAAASIVMALQSIVSRNVGPMQSAVVTVGSLHTGTVCNVIPETATLHLSVRALDPGVRTMVEQRIHALVPAQAASYGVRAEVDYKRDVPVLVNTEPETAVATEVAIELAGSGCVERHGPPLLGSDDFAYFLERCPGSYVLIGNGKGPGSCMVHHPGYDFDDRNVAVGGAFWVLLTERILHLTRRIGIEGERAL